DPDVVDEHQRQLQRLDRPLRHADAVHDLLLWLGDLAPDEIASRAEDPTEVDDWLADLARQRRVLRVRIAGEARLVAVEDAARCRGAPRAEAQDARAAPEDHRARRRRRIRALPFRLAGHPRRPCPYTHGLDGRAAPRDRSARGMSDPRIGARARDPPRARPRL